MKLLKVLLCSTFIMYILLWNSHAMKIASNPQNTETNNNNAKISEVQKPLKVSAVPKRIKQADGPVTEQQETAGNVSYGLLHRKEEEKKPVQPVKPLAEKQVENKPALKELEKPHMVKNLADNRNSSASTPVQNNMSNTSNEERPKSGNFELPVMKTQEQYRQDRSVSRNENFARFSGKKAEYKEVEHKDFVKYLRKDNPVKKATIPSSYQPVQMVKKLSDAGKAALDAQNREGPQYFHLLTKGFESAKMTNAVISKYPTTTLRASSANYLWDHPGGDKDKNLWQNIEYNRYGNNIQGGKAVFEGAKFSHDAYGNTRVTAPAGSGVQITAPTPTIYSMGFRFLETETNTETKTETKTATSTNTSTTTQSESQLPKKSSGIYDDDHTGFKVIDAEVESIF